MSRIFSPVTWRGKYLYLKERHTNSWTQSINNFVFIAHGPQEEGSQVPRIKAARFQESQKEIETWQKVFPFSTVFSNSAKILNFWFSKTATWIGQKTRKTEKFGNGKPRRNARHREGHSDAHKNKDENFFLEERSSSVSWEGDNFIFTLGYPAPAPV